VQHVEQSQRKVSGCSLVVMRVGSSFGDPTFCGVAQRSGVVGIYLDHKPEHFVVLIKLNHCGFEAICIPGRGNREHPEQQHESTPVTRLSL